MRSSLVGVVSALLLCVVIPQAMAQKARPSDRPAPAKIEAKPTPPTTREADEKAIRQLAQAFVKAYNAHDAKAVAALFTTDAEIVNEEGIAMQGRSEIERIFADNFAEHPESTISVSIKSVRLLSPTLAIEDGSTVVVREPDGTEEPSRYTVVHAKQDGKWLMASARDLAEEASEETLEQLDWLVGEWVDESPDGVVITSTHWTDNHRFLLSDFTMQVGGRPLLHGTQRIAWDPLAKVIRSWIFDSEGGFADGVYSRDGEQWLVKLTGVTRDGDPISATNVLTLLSSDRMTWQSRDRTLAGETQPDIPPVMIVRKPPQPM